jgi:hypothetical protein
VKKYLFEIIAVPLVGLLFFVCLGFDANGTPAWWSPLQQLEHRTRQIPALHTIYMAPTDDAYAMQAARVATIVENVLGVQVNFIKMDDPDLAGWTMLQGTAPRAVNIDQGLHWTARLEVLSHEAAHRLQPPVFPPSSSESEVFAEAVSFLVCRAYGHDSLEISANYLAVHKGGLHVLHDYRMEIDYAVAILTAGI